MQLQLARILRGLARRIEPRQPDLMGFLDARQKELGSVADLDLAAVIQAYCCDRQSFFFLQIGAHDGQSNDPLMQLITPLGLHGILVEPQAHQFTQLAEKYGETANVTVEHAAVADSDGMKTLFKVDPVFWANHKFPAGIESQISSLDPDQIRRHVAFFGGDALAAKDRDYMIEESVPALTLATLIAKHQVEQIDLLQIDTEGFDFEIIKMIDWRNPPPLIHFETIHLSIEDRCGAWNLLREHDYALFATDTFNTLAIGRGSARVSQ